MRKPARHILKIAQLHPEHAMRHSEILDAGFFVGDEVGYEVGFRKGIVDWGWELREFAAEDAPEGETVGGGCGVFVPGGV